MQKTHQLAQLGRAFHGSAPSFGIKFVRLGDKRRLQLDHRGGGDAPE